MVFAVGEQNRAVRVVADGAAEFIAVRLRHHDVEKDEIILCEVRRKIRRYMRHAGNGMPSRRSACSISARMPGSSSIARM